MQKSKPKRTKKKSRNIYIRRFLDKNNGGKPMNRKIKIGWIDADALKKSMKNKKTAKRCTKCIYYPQAKRERPKSPECQHHILMNTENFCTERTEEEQ